MKIQRLGEEMLSLREKEVSLQKAYEDLLQAQEHLVQSVKMTAVGELVTSVVHEMRTAMKASGRGGKMEVSAEVSDSNERLFVTVAVSDNVQGISKQDLRRILQPFFTTKRKGLQYLNPVRLFASPEWADREA